jgi:hypothetical protein
VYGSGVSSLSQSEDFSSVESSGGSPPPSTWLMTLTISSTTTAADFFVQRFFFEVAELPLDSPMDASSDTRLDRLLFDGEEAVDLWSFVLWSFVLWSLGVNHTVPVALSVLLDKTSSSEDTAVLVTPE